LLLTFVALAFCVVEDVRTQFINFQQEYGRNYATQQEFEHRFAIFQQNLKRNEDLMKANPLATFGVNKFADLSPQEFSDQYLMKFNPNDYVRPPPLENATAATAPKNVRQCSVNPNNYNWFDCGACTGIYDQGACGSCWAFSATETIESYWYLSGSSLTSLSMEQIVDCDTNDGGCGGGSTTGAYSYVQSAGGIETYSDYPYTAENGQSGTCQDNSGEAVVNVQNVYSVSGEQGIYNQLSNAGGCCNNGGPVSVCVDASTWYSYTGGVMTSCPQDIDHCVQAVGYANYGETGAYWIVRNQWGTGWGMGGFIYIAIGQDLCAIGDYATVVSVSSV